MSALENLERTGESGAEGGDAARALRMLADTGFVLFRNLLTREELAAASEAAIRVELQVRARIGDERFASSVSSGHIELRLPALFDPLFFDFLQRPEVIALVDQALGTHAILRFQQLQVSRPPRDGDVAADNQGFHQNFKFHLQNGSGALVLVEFVFCLQGASCLLELIPGSQRLAAPPGRELEQSSVRLQVHPGDLLVFDPFVWHRDLTGETGATGWLLTQQFSKPFIKQHIDYMRALPADIIAALPERTRKLLGAHAQVPTRLEEFYLPADQRPYRPGQWS
jgi:ectoine hydroxylase-related dioxygenase (phytanoyl-CoA dioxygenase family)